MKTRERDLLAKEAELNRREKVTESNRDFVFTCACISWHWEPFFPKMFPASFFYDVMIDCLVSTSLCWFLVLSLVLLCVGNQKEGRRCSTRLPFGVHPLDVLLIFFWCHSPILLLIKQFHSFPLAAGIVLEEKNWPPFFPIIHHDIGNEIPVHLQRTQYVAFASLLGMLSLTFIWKRHS